MTDLLLDKKLRTKPSKDVRAIARARTLSLLQKLKGDGLSKGALIPFLYEANLILGSRSVLSLNGADLSEVDLRNAILPSINLEGSSIMRGQFQGTHLECANLISSYLDNAKLSGALLTGTKLNKAYLLKTDFSGADLRNSIFKDAVVLEDQLKSVSSLSGAIMPDGTPYDGTLQLGGDPELS